MTLKTIAKNPSRGMRARIPGVHGLVSFVFFMAGLDSTFDSSFGCGGLPSGGTSSKDSKASGNDGREVLDSGGESRLPQ
jgi:hypothetical protein